MKNQKGFSLIELLIVVVIIGIIAAIAIPNLLAARRSANEGSAISAVRTLHGAQFTYASTYGNGNYAVAIATLGLNTIGLIDSVLASGSKSGYGFSGVGVPANAGAGTPASFYVEGHPLSVGTVTATGTRSFCTETDGVLKSITPGTAAVVALAACTGAPALAN